MFVHPSDSASSSLSSSLRVSASPPPDISIPPHCHQPEPTSSPVLGSRSWSDKEFTLMKLIVAAVLDSASQSCRPPSLSEGGIDQLLKFIKRNFASWRMTRCEIR